MFRSFWASNGSLIELWPMPLTILSVQRSWKVLLRGNLLFFWLQTVLYCGLLYKYLSKSFSRGIRFKDVEKVLSLTTQSLNVNVVKAYERHLNSLSGTSYGRSILLLNLDDLGVQHFLRQLLQFVGCLPTSIRIRPFRYTGESLPRRNLTIPSTSDSRN